MKNPAEVTNVIVSVHVAASNPILPIIKVEEVIIHGSGVLTEEIFGGRVTLHLQLTAGKEIRPLKDGELVYVRGHRNGALFIMNSPLTTDRVKEPWSFSRTSGSTGPSD